MERKRFTPPIIVGHEISKALETMNLPERIKIVIKP